MQGQQVMPHSKVLDMCLGTLRNFTSKQQFHMKLFLYVSFHGSCSSVNHAYR